MTETRTPNKKRWGRWVLLILLLPMAFMAWVTWQWHQYSRQYESGFRPPEMAAAQFSKHEVVGDLGGMPVTIPSYFANYVEYDGDPGFGEKRKGPVPVRTYQSKLRSFGFYVRYPDMAGLSSAEMWKDKDSYQAYDTPWISVGINTGHDGYPGDGFLDRWMDATLGEKRVISKYEDYEKLPKQEHGLTAYVPAGIDPQTQQPYRKHDNAKDLFLHRDASGKIDTVIRCGHRPHPMSAHCEHGFSLGPKAKGDISILYRRSLLPEWRSIQQAVQQQILGFEAPPTAVNTNTSSGNGASKH